MRGETEYLAVRKQLFLRDKDYSSVRAWVVLIFLQNLRRMGTYGTE